ncbi:SCO6880 family protein [Antribacter gilvus]|uniref:SCO6880 family protein n=1 Tax=Antribacter gilvus TaxID=2304675 RepID=UPI0019813680|nr:SCO6880 family protein [Antribacter gilvus]
MAAAETTRQVRTYGNWRRPVSPGLLGLGTASTMGLVAGLLMIVVLVFLTDLLTATVFGLGVAALVVVLRTRDVHRRNVLQRVGGRLAWWSARGAGAHLYRSGPLGRVPWGTFHLPGILAATTLTEHLDGLSRPFALLYTPKVETYTVVLGTEPPGMMLVDEDQIDLWVADWGHFLRNLSDEPGLESAAVTVETAPDTGHRLRRQVESRIDPSAPAFSRELLREVVDAYPSGSNTVRAFVSLTFSARGSSGKRRTPDETARDLAARLPGLTSDLQATGAGAAWPLSAQEVCEVVRIAFDPPAATLIDEARAAGTVAVQRWSDVGPTAAEASWTEYRHDGAWSKTWAMTEAPRGYVHSAVLARLLAPHRDIARKRVTLLFEPIDAGRAAKIVEDDQRDARYQATSSRTVAARDDYSLRAAQATAAEEAAGAGLVNFAVLVTATVTDPDRRRDAAAAIDYLANTARLRLRLLHGSQDSAFAAALPLGLNLRKHVAVPKWMKEEL